MSLYKIELFDENGSIIEWQFRHFDKDDDALDHAGQCGHPHAIGVWREETHIAKFPPEARS